MRIEKADAPRLDQYLEIVAACKASRQRRLEQYGMNRRWYLYGTDEGNVSAWNKIYSHLDLVTSILYAADSTRFSVRMGSNAPRVDSKKTQAFGRKITEEWGLQNADIVYGQAILWALIYDTCLVKHIRRSGSCEPFMVDPGSFGVYREDVMMLDRQEAFVHWWYMTKSDLERRLRFHPKREEIMKGVTASMSQQQTQIDMPPLIDRVVTNAVSPSMVGEVNIELSAPPEYLAQVNVPLIEMAELWVWNDEEDDYQTVTMADTQIVYDRKNIFLPRQKDMEAEHPFVQICPNALYDYFWGIAECARLIPLQRELNEAEENNKRLYQKQVDPPTAWEGMGLVEEKLFGFNSPGAQIAGEPGTKAHQMKWEIPAESSARIERIKDQFEDTSGTTNVMAGRGESGVRSAGHAGKLLTAGSSRPKKRGLTIEDSLEKGATIFGKVIYCDDDTPLYDEDGVKFVPAQMDPHFFVEVDAHSNSPVFMEDQKEKAAVLFKARAINRKRLIQMVNPPMQDELLSDLKNEILPGEKAAEQARNQALAQGQAGKHGVGKLTADK